MEMLTTLAAVHPVDYLKPELTAETQPKPDFSDFLDRVCRGQAAVGKERAVPVVLGEQQISLLQLQWHDSCWCQQPRAVSRCLQNACRQCVEEPPA